MNQKHKSEIYCNVCLYMYLLVGMSFNYIISTFHTHTLPLSLFQSPLQRIVYRTVSNSTWRCALQRSRQSMHKRLQPTVRPKKGGRDMRMSSRNIDQLEQVSVKRSLVPYALSNLRSFKLYIYAHTERSTYRGKISVSGGNERSPKGHETRHHNPESSKKG